MNSPRSGHTGGYLALALGALLLASPGFAKGDEPNQCELTCAASLSQETYACMQKCPPASRKAKRDEFQACSSQCTARFNKAYQKCARPCGGNASKPSGHDHDEPKKKKKKKTR